MTNLTMAPICGNCKHFRPFRGRTEFPWMSRQSILEKDGWCQEHYDKVRDELSKSLTWKNWSEMRATSSCRLFERKA